MLRHLFFVIFTFVALSRFLAQGCSQCKLMAEQGAGLDDNAFTNNINYGILYLMAFPYIILMILFRKPIVRFLKSLFQQGSASQ